MKISIEPTTYHKYKIDFEDSPFSETLDFCRFLKNSFGWKEFSYTEKAWRFTKPLFIELIKSKFPDVIIDENISLSTEEIELKQKQTAITEKKIEKIKTATTSKLKIKGIKGKLYDFQKLAVEFLITNNNRGMLALDTGLGKSLASLAFIIHTKQKKSLIVCPASVKYSWLNECKKWSKLKAFVIDSNNSFGLKDYQDNDIIILNYDILKKHFDLLSSLNFDCIIFDESAYIKNPRAIRSKASKQLSKNIKSVILLTATPLLARPIELFQQLNIIAPNVWINYYTYAKRYCAMWKSPWGMDVSGSSHIDELKEKIKPYIIRKRKEEVLKELPDKNFINVPIELNIETKSKYKLLENSFIDYLRDIKDKTDKEIKKSLHAKALVKLGELRRLTSEGKINHAKEIIRNIIDSGEKILVFSCYNKPIEELQSMFKKESVKIIGSTPAIDRQKAIDAFQTNNNIKIFFGGMLSAGTGITLTAANNVLFIDMDWTPANMYQCIGRCDRIGNKANKINIYQLIALNTIDQKMSKMLTKKQDLIDVLIEGKEIIKEKNNSIVKDLFEFYSK